MSKTAITPLEAVSDLTEIFIKHMEEFARDQDKAWTALSCLNSHFGGPQEPVEPLYKNDQPRESEQVGGAVCPKCGSELVERANRQTGAIFLGCKSYPACKYSGSLFELRTRSVE
jgi:hypothetical protein